MKTVENDESVNDFLASVQPEYRQADCFLLLERLQEWTGFAPKMWGENMVGFGKYHYRYESGHEGDFFYCGFSPRKANLTIYAMPYSEEIEVLKTQLGKVKCAKSCIYVKKLSDVDLNILKEIIQRSVKGLQERYG